MSEFVLKLDPAERIVFIGKKLGDEAATTQLKVENPTKDRYAIKVKCTKNDIFRIRPAVSIVEAGKDFNVWVNF